MHVKEVGLRPLWPLDIGAPIWGNYNQVRYDTKQYASGNESIGSERNRSLNNIVLAYQGKD